MRLVVKGLAKLPDSDLKAIAAYLVSLNRPSRAAPDIARAMAPDPPANPREHPGLTIYRANCAGCHDHGGTARSPLGLNASLWLEDKPQNFIRTVLDGIDANDGLPGAMPAFRDKLSDDDLEALAAYLRITRTNAPGWPSMRELIRRTLIEAMSPP
jgi:mono/diheme cytochrome c family protein